MRALCTGRFRWCRWCRIPGRSFRGRIRTPPAGKVDRGGQLPERKRTMGKRRWLWLLALILIVGGATLLWPNRDDQEGYALPVRYEQDGESADLPQDLKLMWETWRLGKTGDPSHGPDPHAST